MEKAKAAKSAEELLELAKAENIELTAEEAAKYFAELHKSGELSDAELENAAGGGCGGQKTPDGRAESEKDVVFLFAEGQDVLFFGNYGGGPGVILKREARYRSDGWYPYYFIELTNENSGWVRQSTLNLI